MLKKIILTACILAEGFCLQNYAQTTPDSLLNLRAKENQEKAIKKSKNDSIRKANTIYKPVIGIGPGIFNFFGDVNHNKSVNPMIPSYGFNLNISQSLSPSFRVDFDFVMGNLVANERSVDRSLNFKSRVINGSVMATYNFAGILKPDRVLNPYLSVGVGILNFDSKGDLTDENGATYYYWSDGSIRSLAQDDPNAESSIELERDYKYETDLRQQNLDLLGKYSQVALTIPVSFGFDFRVSERLKLKLGSIFYYTFTDMIDNVSTAGAGVRKGNEAKDMFLFSSFSVHYDFFTPKKKVDEGPYTNVDFTSLDQEDDDGDGVINFADWCAGTPSGVPVDVNGCPFDKDADGVPDYKDDEPNSAAGATVDVKGNTVSDELIESNYQDTTGTNRAKMFEIYPDMRELYPLPGAEPVKEEKKTETKSEQNTGTKDFSEVIKKLESGQVKEKPVIKGNKIMETADLNKDKVISGEEVHWLIEDFLDDNSELTLPQLSEIIDYLFEQ